MKGGRSEGTHQGEEAYEGGERAHTRGKRHMIYHHTKQSPFQKDFKCWKFKNLYTLKAGVQQC